MPDVMGNLNKVLAGREFIEGDAFSVSDVAVGAYLLYIPALAPQVRALLCAQYSDLKSDHCLDSGMHYITLHAPLNKE
jgi:glutathione S-transferase